MYSPSHVARLQFISDTLSHVFFLNRIEWPLNSENIQNIQTEHPEASCPVEPPLLLLLCKVHPALTFQVQPLKASAASCSQTLKQGENRQNAEIIRGFQKYFQIPENAEHGTPPC